MNALHHKLEQTSHHALTGVAIVVPCFNEAKRLEPRAFESFAHCHAGARFVFVDDGSTDETHALLLQLCEREPQRFELLTLEKNLGQGEAVRAGISHALRSDARYVGYWDADLATPLEEIPRFAEVLDRDEHCVLVLGSRRPTATNHVRRKPLRYALGRAFAWTAAGVLRMGVYDTQCGAKLFRRSPETASVFATAFVSRWIFDVEILVRLIRLRGSARAARTSVHELALHAWRDVEGSKLTPLDFARAPWELLKIGLSLFR